VVAVRRYRDASLVDSRNYRNELKKQSGGISPIVLSRSKYNSLPSEDDNRNRLVASRSGKYSQQLLNVAYVRCHGFQQFCSVSPKHKFAHRESIASYLFERNLRRH